MITFEPETLYYIRFTDGEEVLSEIFTVQHDDKTVSFALFRPVAIKIMMLPETGKFSLIDTPFVDLTISDDQIFDFNPATIVLSTTRISQTVEDIYYKNWSRHDTNDMETTIEDEQADELHDFLVGEDKTKKDTIH